MLLATLSACRKADNESDADYAVAPVEAALVAKKDIERIVTADAVVYPIKQSSVTPKISAPVRRFLVNRGDHVKQGQLLAELENRDLVAVADETRAAYDQAQATYRTTTAATLPEDMTKSKTDVETARQGLDAAQRLYQNRVALVKEGALSQKLADDAKVALTQAQSQYEIANEHLQALETVSREEQIKGAKDQVAAAKAHWLGAQAQVAYSEVRSPISGVVSDRPISDGEMASSSSPLITIVDVSEIVARANIPAADLRGVTAGQAANIRSGVDEIPGRVWIVSPSVDPASTTVEVWVKAQNPKEQLKPGTTAKLEIHSESIPGALIIPESALFSSDDGSDTVLVVKPDSTVQWRPVKIGIQQDKSLQILDGLREGERVVTAGGSGLEDNAKVRIEKSDAP